MGQEWDLVNDTLLPIKYLAPRAKIKGQVLKEFNKDTIKDIPVTRRLVSRVLAQLYYSRGIFLSPLVIGMNIFLSRSCKLATSAKLDLDLSEKDTKLSMLFRDYLLHILDHFDDIETFPCCMIRVGEEALAFVASHDGSVSGYSMIGHLITGNDKGDLRSQIVTAKNKIGKHTVVMQELLSLVLAVAHSSVLRLLPDEALKTIKRVVLPGDSTIIATFCQPPNLTNLSPGKVCCLPGQECGRGHNKHMSSGNGALEMDRGAINPSDLNSKLHMRPIMAVKSDMYR